MGVDQIEALAGEITSTGLLEALLNKSIEKTKNELEALLSRERVERAPVDVSPNGDLLPRNMDGYWRIARTLVATYGAVPESLVAWADDRKTVIDQQATTARVFLALVTGRPLGLTIASCLKFIAIINGSPSIWGDGALSLAQSHAKYEWHKEGVTTVSGKPNDFSLGTFGYHIIKRQGQEPHEVRFSVEDATRANLWQNSKKDPWIKYPQRMLYMRARSWALRDKFADALGGLRVAEEEMDADNTGTQRIDVDAPDSRKPQSRAAKLLEDLPDPKKQAPAKIVVTEEAPEVPVGPHVHTFDRQHPEFMGVMMCECGEPCPEAREAFKRLQDLNKAPFEGNQPTQQAPKEPTPQAASNAKPEAKPTNGFLDLPTINAPLFGRGQTTASAVNAR